jgi:hypothetical protein
MQVVLIGEVDNRVRVLAHGRCVPKELVEPGTAINSDVSS